VEQHAPERYRSLSAQPIPAAYVDGEGTILSSNDAFAAFRGEVLDGRSTELAALPVLFTAEDQESIRCILAAPRRRVRRTFRSALPSPALASMSAEFIRIRRKSQADVLWLVTLDPSHQVSGASPDLALKAVVTENIVEDLRAPLQEVLGWTSLLRRNRDDAVRTEQALEAIERNAELVIRLMEGLVEHARRGEVAV
jgi:signal transduction histidine kinase